MKYFYHGVLLSALMLSLASCSEESWVASQGEGRISLSLKTDAQVSDATVVTRASSVAADVPSAEDFSISLTKLDGSFAKSWQKLSEFIAEDAFPTGAYTIEATYGSLNEEGFESPCYSASAPVTVLEQRTVPVELTATLASAMISIEYTDAFKGYFTDYSSAVHSEGHDFITIGADETRPVYLAPGQVDVNVSFTTPQGKSATLQPASFQTLAAHHYHLTLDVNNGNVGTAAITVSFDDSVEQEDVVIDLTDELFSSPAPSVSASGFLPGSTLEILEGTEYAQTARWQVVAKGGLSACTMTVNSDSYTPAFGNEIDLMAANDARKGELENAGIKCAGLWKNPDKMAYVDFTDFLSKLPAGKHVLSLVAKDRFTRVSEPVSLTVEVSPVQVTASAGPIIVGAESTKVNVSFNGGDPTGKFSFKAMNRLGTMEECKVLSVVKKAASRAYEMQDYEFTISVPDTEREEIPLDVYYLGNLMQHLVLKVKLPVYSVSVQPYGTVAEISVQPQDTEDMATVVSNLILTVGSQKVPEQNVTRDNASGLITVRGLNPTTEYHLQTGLVAGNFATDNRFTTESAEQVPNGDFESLRSVLSNVTIDSGGPYSNISNWSPITNKKTFNVSEPQGWATVNAKTFNQSASTKNTWFMQPSTLNVTDAKSGSAAMQLVSVGYAYSGSVPGRATHINSTDYNNKTATVANRAAGKLFLGSYGVNYSDLSETYTQGVAFSSRPSALKGFFKYVPCNSDQGTVEVKLYNDSELVASGSATFSASDSYKEFSVPLTYENRTSRPNRLCIMFASSKAASASASEETSNVPAVAITEHTQAYIGSKLTIDNLTFDYAVPTFKNAARKRSVTKKNNRR